MNRFATLTMISGVLALSALASCAVSSPQSKVAVQPSGTGVLLHHDGQEYVVTAKHVVDSCGFQPWIHMNGRWVASEWEVIGNDEEADISVLQRVGDNDRMIAKYPVPYGADSIWGSNGTALGFPDGVEPTEWSEMDWGKNLIPEGDRQHGNNRRPLPIPYPASAPIYMDGRKISLVGAYLNHGVSGGPVVIQSGNTPSIAGIVVQKRHARVGDDRLIEHAGVVGVANIFVAEEIIRNHKGQTREAFKAGKPLVDDREKARGPLLTLANHKVMNSVISLGCLVRSG